MRYIILSVLIITLSSCSHYKWMHKNKDYVCKTLCCSGQIDSIIVKDTVITFETQTLIEPDFATIDLYLDCDSLNQVYLTKVDELTGKRISLTYLLENNRLNLRAKTDSLDIVWKMYKELKGFEKTVYVDREVPVEVIKYRSYWWHWLLDGALLMLALVCLVKPKKKL